MRLMNWSVAFLRSLRRLNRTHARAESAERDIAELKEALAERTKDIAELAATRLRDLERNESRHRALSRGLAAKAAALDMLARFAGARDRKEEAGGEEHNEAPPPEITALLDTFYVALEERFRGDQGDIGARQEIYVPDVQQAVERSRGGPVLDLGCGRGEWLALLRDHGIAGMGVDTNSGQLAVARERGLAVTESDGLLFLRAQPDSHFSVVSAFHIFEHLPFSLLAEWLVEIQRVLRPGGVLIMETPNPETLLVGAYSFHLDPTHTRPLPSGVLALLCETVGFGIDAIRPLHPHAGLANHVEALPVDVAYLLYGYQDYGIIARKDAMKDV